MNKIFILGDHHGDYGRLFRQIREYGMENSILVHVGDGGEGLPNLKTLSHFEFLDKQFKSFNCKYYSIRGNHSDPSLFTGESRIVLPNLELLEDYTTMELNGELWQFVGGATSVNRKTMTVGWDCWEGEEFVLDLNKAVKCDVLVTHTIPSWNGVFGKSGIQHFLDEDPHLWDELVKERFNIDKLINACKPKRHYGGHVHIYAYQDLADTESRIIEINGIYLDSGAKSC